MPKRTNRVPVESGTLTRKFYFYRANVGTARNGQPIPFDPTPALSHIEELNGGDQSGRYHRTSNGAETLCLVHRNSPNQRVCLGSVRRTGLPQQEARGQFSPLSIPLESGIVEPIHIVFFPDNIVGCEFNFHGPRISQLRDFFVEKGGGHCRNLTFSALLRQNAAESLANMKHLKFFKLKIHASFAERIAQANESLGNAFIAAREVGGSEMVEIIFRPEKRTALAKLGNGLIDAVRGLATLPDIQEQAKSFAIAGIDEETGQRREIDFLNEQLISVKRVTQSNPRSRAVEANSAYDAIEEAYGELRPQLLTVAGVEV